jgi:altronate hydrolase
MENSDLQYIRIHASDNVLVALVQLEADTTIGVDGDIVPVRERIRTGHKLALKAIGKGEKIIKYGMPIGSAVVDILPGEHVHTHNMKSDYINTIVIHENNERNAAGLFTP